MNRSKFVEAVQATVAGQPPVRQSHYQTSETKPSPETVVQGVSAALAEHCYRSDTVDCHTYMDAEEATLSISGPTLPATLVELLVSCPRTITTALHAESDDCDTVTLSVQFDDAVHQNLCEKDSLFDCVYESSDTSE